MAGRWHVAASCRSTAAVAGGLIAAMVVARAAPAQVSWNAAQQFSPTSNPGGAWAYGYKTAAGQPFTAFAFSRVSFGGLDSWFRGSPDIYPEILHNGTAGTLNLGPGSPVEPGEMIMLPGPGTVRGVLRWTAPCAGQFSFEIALSANTAACGPTSSTANVYVLVNGVQTQTGHTDLITVFNHSFSVPLSGGQHVEVEIDNRNGSIDCDHISANMIVTGLGITQQPQSLFTCRAVSPTFTVAASGTSLAYRWQLESEQTPDEWSDLSDGAVPGLGVVSGAMMPTLSIALDGVDNDVRDLAFRCIVTNACGSVTSNPATLTICPADFNCSGGPPTVQDIFDFLAAYFAGEPAGDFNGSGTWTVQDIFDFLAAYFAGCG